MCFWRARQKSKTKAHPELESEILEDGVFEKQIFSN